MQTSIQEAMPPEYGAPPELRPEDHIRLDKTRVTFVRHPDGEVAVDPKGQVIKTLAFSSVHSSERTPQDPYFNVSYMQDGLPFDGNGNLVSDDRRMEPFVGPGPDGKPITYQPLYTKAMRQIVEKKMRRIKAGVMSKAPSDDDIEEDVYAREAESDTINVPGWLMGHVDYPFFMVNQAIKRRWGASMTSVPEAVRFLVFDVNPPVVIKEKVADKYQRCLMTPAG
jgi:hypothetical protein